MNKYVAIALLMCCMVSSTYGLTDPAVKYPGLDLYMESPSLERQTPDRFEPHTLATAPTDFSYWRNVLPFPQHRNEDLYLVIPQLGLITPIVEIPKGSNDEALMTQGQTIDINKYLVDGAIEYVQSPKPGFEGKRIDFAHSNHFTNSPGDFKTIFANLMRLDAGDQVWYYQKNITGGYDLLRYRVTSSYPTDPSNVSALRRDGEGADALVFGCYHGLDGRWMVEATYLGEVQGVRQQVNEFPLVSATLKYRIDQAVQKMQYVGINQRKVHIIGLRNSLQLLQERLTSQEHKQIIDYTMRKLLEIYPS